jgi:AcrR family transcriptional regulator
VAEGKPDGSARDALIAAAAQRLWTNDECDLRILDVCQETGLSTSVIYGHFRSRQGLIDAALLRIFAEVTEGIVRDVDELVNGAHPTGRLLDTLHAFLTDPARERDLVRHRQAYVRVSATALARPSIRPGFLDLYGEYLDRCSELYDGAVRRGLLSDRLSGRQWTLVLESQMMARAFHDLDASWDDHGDWVLAIARLTGDVEPAGEAD